MDLQTIQEFSQSLFTGPNKWIGWSAAVASAVMFIGGLVMIPIIAVRIPEDYFLDEYQGESAKRHPVLHVLVIIGRNILGVGLIVLGILLSVPLVPGQGLLTILVGLMLMTIPGKKRLLRFVVGIPQVNRGLNALRAKYGKPPLKLRRDDDETNHPEENQSS